MVDINNEKDSVITSNGQSLACVIFALDSLAKDGGVTVQVTTLHQHDCPSMNLRPEESKAAAVGALSSWRDSTDYEGDEPPEGHRAHVILQNMQNLFRCVCDPELEALFATEGGDMLATVFQLSAVQRENPWLVDVDETTDLLEWLGDLRASELGDSVVSKLALDMLDRFDVLKLCLQEERAQVIHNYGAGLGKTESLSSDLTVN
jgi:hypothetical protein|tara:strand:- start:3227 stop:3841 length:615 start_codon:yes stop_codon:yes gene_type:complete